MNSEKEFIYYDILITNEISNNTNPPNAIYNEVRQSPLIKNPDDYFMSIVRFQINGTQTLPVFTAQMQDNQSDINLSVYSITMSYTSSTNVTINYQQYLQFIPQFTFGGITPTNPNDNTSSYYNIYDYNYICFLINNTFISCLNGLTVSATTAGITLPSTTAPIISYDGANSLFTITFDTNPSWSTNQTGFINTYFNQALFSLFCSFPALYLTYNSSTGQNIQLNLLTSSNSKPLATLQQNYATIENLSPIVSIVFTTTLIPVFPSLQGTPYIYTNNTTTQTYNNSISNIISDFIADLYTPNLIYEPTIQRYYSLQGNQPINNVDLQLFYKTKTGLLVPIKISSGSYITVKILFIKKTFIKI
jgi:hypothetical protein